jgi:hypothetical protein
MKPTLRPAMGNPYVWAIAIATAGISLMRGSGWAFCWLLACWLVVQVLRGLHGLRYILQVTGRWPVNVTRGPDS